MRLSARPRGSWPSRMQAAFLDRFPVLPPPAPCAQVLAGHHPPGTRGAADARVALIVKGVVRDVVGADVLSAALEALRDQMKP